MVKPHAELTATNWQATLGENMLAPWPAIAFEDERLAADQGSFRAVRPRFMPARTPPVFSIAAAWTSVAASARDCKIRSEAAMKLLASRAWHSPTLTTWGSIFVRLASVGVLLPLVLRRYDAPEVAVWQLFSVLFALALLFDFGLAPTFARLLAYARGGATLDEMARPTAAFRDGTADLGPAGTAAVVLSAQRWLYLRLGIVAALAFGLLGSWALLRPIAQTANPVAAWWAWGMVLATMAVGFWGNGYGAALQGMDYIAVLRRWEIGCGLAQVLSSSLVLLAGGGLLELVASYQFWVVFNAVRNRMLMKQQCPELMAAPVRADHSVLRVLWPATWRSGVGVLMSQGIVQASGVIFSQVGGPAEVAAYLLALRVMTVISQLATAPFYSKLPQLAKLQMMQQRTAQVALAKRGMRMAHWTFVIGVGLVALLAQALLDLIGSRTAFVSPVVWALMCLAFFTERFGAMHLQLYSVTNHILWHIANGVAGTLMIGLSLVLYPALGLTALPLGMLLAYAGFYCVYSFGKSSRSFGFTLLGFERDVSLLPALALATVITGTAVWRH